MEGADWPILAGVVVLFVVSVVLAMAETAFVRINKIRALTLEEEGRKGAARLVQLLEHPERTLNIVLLIVLVCQLTAATLVGVLVEDSFGAFGVVAGTAIEVIAFFVFAEVAPKTYAIQHTDAAALRLAGTLWALSTFPPLRMLSRGLIGLANVFLPGKGLKEGPFTSEEEIRTMADVAAQEEVIEGEERRLIHSIFEFGDTVVREVMVPRPDMVGVEDDLTLEQALHMAIEAGYSRLPVFRENHDNILGLVYLKDMARAVSRSGNGGSPGDPPAEAPDLASLVRPAVFVPEQKRVAELLREMQTKKFHMAIVFDEYGGTAGLVTMEDLLEEIVGEIVDEYDVEVPRIETLDDGCLLVAGRTSIDEISEVLGVELPDTEWDTVGGLMFNLLGRVPVQGETVAFEGIDFRAEEVQGRRILTVHIERAETQPAEANS